MGPIDLPLPHPFGAFYHVTVAGLERSGASRGKSNAARVGCEFVISLLVAFHTSFTPLFSFMYLTKRVLQWGAKGLDKGPF